MNDPHFDQNPPVDPPVSIRHVFQVLRAYAGAMFLGLIAVSIGYGLIAFVRYLTAPAEKTASLPFRLEFEGASEGRYPNGMRFTMTDVVSTPVLLKVYDGNRLSRFTPFSQFTHAVFVLEQNKEYERLAAVYRTRLADPRLSMIDRERMEKEWDEKRASVSKNDYSVNLSLNDATDRIPSILIQKVLGDILRTWAEDAVHSRGVLRYDVAVLSPDSVRSSPIRADDAMGSALLLRIKAVQALQDLRRLEALPGFAVVRTTRGRKSLADIRSSLEDMLRFRIEPLIASISGSAPASLVSIRLLETQVAFDERELAIRRERAEAIRATLTAYAGSGGTGSLDTVARNAPAGTTPSTSSESPIVPQLSDSFLDRLVQLTSGATDQKYRQKLADDLRAETIDSIPFSASAEYHKGLLADLRARAGSGPPTQTGVAELQQVQTEVASLVAEINEIHSSASRNLNATNQLYTPTSPVMTAMYRSVSLTRLALIGVVVVLGTIPFLLIATFIHYRMRQEETREAE